MKKAEFVWKWDKWQQEVLDYDGNIAIRAGRQVGKSVVIAEKVCRFALAHSGAVCLVIAASQRQSGLLFEKIKNTLLVLGRDVLAEVPTLTRLVLKNGSRIYTLPAGKTGHFIRGYTLDLLIVDEAAYVSEAVFNSIVPMIAVSRKVRGFGRIILLSTPFGKGGFFYHCFSDDDFRKWHVSSEDCERIYKKLLLKEKKRLRRAEYAQEWLGEFVDDYQQFFGTEVLRRQMTLSGWDLSQKLDGSGFYLGVDVARYGGDENAFVVVELSGGVHVPFLRVVRCEVSSDVSTVDTIGRVVFLDGLFGFKRVFVDDAGVGGAVTDVLQERLGRKVVGLNNASKRVWVRGENERGEVRRGILKEDLYSNALFLLENGRLELLIDDSLLRSLRSIQFEYGSTKNNTGVLIYGSYSHLAEAFVRACWCVRDRGLDVFCA